MSSIKDDRKLLLELRSKSRFEKMLQTAVVLTKHLESAGLQPIVVGGFAVEIYTRGHYTTFDLDLVTKGRDLAGDILSQLGFVKEGRHWYHQILEVALEIPGNKLEGADINRVLKLELPSGNYIYVIGVEDIIMDRLRACVHWQSSSDCEWGLRLLKVHTNHLDLEYLRKIATEDHPESLKILEQWLAE
jgi:hypothetical protein